MFSVWVSAVMALPPGTDFHLSVMQSEHSTKEENQRLLVLLLSFIVRALV